MSWLKEVRKQLDNTIKEIKEIEKCRAEAVAELERLNKLLKKQITK